MLQVELVSFGISCRTLDAFLVILHNMVGEQLGIFLPFFFFFLILQHLMARCVLIVRARLPLA